MDTGESAVLDVILAGGKGGSLTCRPFDGQRLTGIQAWADSWGTWQKFRGLKLWMSNYSTGQDSETMFGRKRGLTPSEHFKLTVKETITSLQLWDNGAETVKDRRLGRIEIKLNSERTFSFGVQKTQQPPRKSSADVGSGICVGYKVRHGLDIDALGLEFLRPVEKSEITDVKYDVGKLNDLQVPETNLHEISQTNHNSEPVKWSWSGSTTRKLSSEWSFDAAVVIGEPPTVTVTAGIPIIAGVEGNYRWEIHGCNHQGTSETSMMTLTWAATGEIPARSTVKATAISGEGKIDDLIYSATMKITTTGGHVLYYPFQGLYKAVASSNANVVYEGVANPEVTTESSLRSITATEDYSEADVLVTE